jgi:hypothetical protein
MRVPTPSPPLQVPGRLALSDSEKAEALADSLEAQFQPVNDPSNPAVVEMVNEAMRAYDYAPASEPKLSSPSEVLQATKGLKVGKAPGQNGISKMVLRHKSRERTSRCILPIDPSVYLTLLASCKIKPAHWGRNRSERARSAA